MHRLIDKQSDGNCWCSECGPSTYRPHGSGDACVTSILESRRRTVKRRHGLTTNEAKRYVAENGPCNLCGSTDRLVVDHCHATMKIRGVLCYVCNIGLGNLGDNIEGLERALEYLRKGMQ